MVFEGTMVASSHRSTAVAPTAPCLRPVADPLFDEMPLFELPPAMEDCMDLPVHQQGWELRPEKQRLEPPPLVLEVPKAPRLRPAADPVFEDMPELVLPLDALTASNSEEQGRPTPPKAPRLRACASPREVPFLKLPRQISSSLSEDEQDFALLDRNEQIDVSVNGGFGNWETEADTKGCHADTSLLRCQRMWSRCSSFESECLSSCSTRAPGGATNCPWVSRPRHSDSFVRITL